MVDSHYPVKKEHDKTLSKHAGQTIEGISYQAFRWEGFFYYGSTLHHTTPFQRLYYLRLNGTQERIPFFGPVFHTEASYQNEIFSSK